MLWMDKVYRKMRQLIIIQASLHFNPHTASFHVVFPFLVPVLVEKSGLTARFLAHALCVQVWGRILPGHSWHHFGKSRAVHI